MKKFSKLITAMFLVATATSLIISCNKKDDSVLPVVKPHVNAIAGTFNVEDGDILILKDAPLGITRTWTMQARKSSYYGGVAFANVTGLEFIESSAAYKFWSVPANNPITYPASQAVYSNLTPDEDLRLIAETKTADNKVSFLAMLDFNPSVANFPLTLHGFRLGDELSINTYGLTKLSGGNRLTVSVNYGLAPIDLAATKSKLILTGSVGVPNGVEFTWADIVYGASVFSSVNIPASSNNCFVSIYNGLDKKVMGTITITITEAGGTPIVKTVTAKGAGRGLKITLSTTKVGSFDSETIKFCETDIAVDSETVTY